jgi:hypothetical protein
MAKQNAKSQKLTANREDHRGGPLLFLCKILNIRYLSPAINKINTIVTTYFLSK